MNGKNFKNFGCIYVIDSYEKAAAASLSSSITVTTVDQLKVKIYFRFFCRIKLLGFNWTLYRQKKKKKAKTADTMITSV